MSDISSPDIEQSFIEENLSSRIKTQYKPKLQEWFCSYFITILKESNKNIQTFQRPWKNEQTKLSPPESSNQEIVLDQLLAVVDSRNPSRASMLLDSYRRRKSPLLNIIKLTTVLFMRKQYRNLIIEIPTEIARMRKLTQRIDFRLEVMKKYRASNTLFFLKTRFELLQ